jgi:hypothetical protein
MSSIKSADPTSRQDYLMRSRLDSDRMLRLSVIPVVVVRIKTDETAEE